MKIGSVAEATGLSAKTIRYYESVGLVHSERLDNGYRDYGAHALRELRLLASARKVGFSLEECRDLLSLLNNQARHSADVKRQVLQKIAQLDVQMEQLADMRKTLVQLADRCQGDDSPECAILQDLSGANVANASSAEVNGAMRFTLVEDRNG